MYYENLFCEHSANTTFKNYLRDGMIVNTSTVKSYYDKQLNPIDRKSSKTCLNISQKSSRAFADNGKIDYNLVQKKYERTTSQLKSNDVFSTNLNKSYTSPTNVLNNSNNIKNVKTKFSSSFSNNQGILIGSKKLFNNKSLDYAGFTDFAGCKTEK